LAQLYFSLLLTYHLIFYLCII